MSDERPILQYRAMGNRRRRFRVVAVYRIPDVIKPKDFPPRTSPLKYYEYTPLHWGLSRPKALTVANALNALNNLPPHEDKPK